MSTQQQSNSDPDTILSQLSKNIATSRGTKVQSHKQREASAKQIEQDLIAHLDDIIERIKQDRTKEIHLLQSKYGQEVEDTIRAATTSAFIVGINYVGMRKQRLHHMYLTRPDIDEITRLTQDFTNTFWRRLHIFMHQYDVLVHSRSSIKSGRFSATSRFNINSLITSLAIKIVSKAITVATLRKVRALAQVPTRLNLKSAISAADDSTMIDYVVWHTEMDEKVCPFCQSMEGRKWVADDPEILEPPDDAHDNCRCRLDTEQGPPGEAGEEGEGGGEAPGIGVGPFIPPIAAGITFAELTQDQQEQETLRCMEDLMNKNPKLKESDARVQCEKILEEQ